MNRHLVLAASTLAIPILLSGCGGGGGGSPPAPPAPPGPPAPAPPPPPGPCACKDLMKRGHCTACHCDGDAMTCKTCTAPYALDASPDKPEHSCVFKCPETPEPKPAKPSSVQGNNGIKWPTMCRNETTSRFFGIGDWGGMCGWNGKSCTAGEISQDCKWIYDAQGKGYITPGGPCPMPNRGGGHGPFISEIEGRAQQMVSARMQERYNQLKEAGTPPHFVVNVGDNFYPGGIDVHCGKGDLGPMQTQFQQVWKNVYPGPLTDEMEWMSVLGNHDYGGVCYIKGWDQQIWYTYHSPTWVMPGQYYKRSVQYKTFKIDLFMIDGNWFDTDNTGIGAQPNHNICNRNSNPGKYCELDNYPGNGGICDGSGPDSGDDCPGWFNTLWNAQYKWLMKEVPASDAEWQIVVMHYPGNYNLGTGGKDFIEWQKWGPAMGIDLIVTGHTHFQQILYGDFSRTHGDWSETATVITGGGGGVTTEAIPSPNGNDDSYGYMEFTVSLDEINIKTYTHGGVQNKQILRNQTTVKPVAKKSDEEIIRRGLDPQNLLRKHVIAV